MRFWPFGGKPDPLQQQRIEVERLKLQHEANTLRTLTESVSLNNQFVNSWDIYGPNQGFGDFAGGGMSLAMDRNSRGDLPQAYIGEGQLKWARERSRHLSITNEFARNALATRQNYIVGQGFVVTPVARREDQELPEALEQAVKDFLQEFAAVNRWGLMQREGVFRGDRDGDAFFRLAFDGDGMTKVRFIEPEFVGDWEGTAPFGLMTDSDDFATVLQYVVRYPGGDVEKIDASEVVYAKCNTDSGIRRGLPFLYPIHQMLANIEKLDDNMGLLAAIQASIAYIKRSQVARQSAIQTNANSQTAFTINNPHTGNTDSYRQVKGGAIIETGHDTEYEFPAAGVGLQSFVAAKESMLRTAAAGACMPEYMFTGDASNGNFASTQIAESPSVMNFMAWQMFWQHIFGCGVYYPNADNGVLWRAIEHAASFGRLPKEVLTEVKLDCRGPEIVIRDALQNTNRLQILKTAGVIDNDKWAQEEGYDEAYMSSEEMQKQEDKKQADELAMKQKNNPAPPKAA